jgi:hypothetical protein
MPNISELNGKYIGRFLPIVSNGDNAQFKIAWTWQNRNVEQQKALIFESDTCKYDVILGADFLTETEIDVKYSLGTIEWFKNELTLCNPHDLKDKDFKAMVEIIEIQQEVFFLYGLVWPNLSVHLNDLKAVGVIGIVVSVIVIGVVVVYHKYSRID